MAAGVWRNLAGLAALAVAVGVAYALHQPAPPDPWRPAELQTIRSLALDALPPPPDAPGNAVANHPLAQRLGHRLFFDARLSANGLVSCATCHQPARRFTDGLPRAVGGALGSRNSMSLVGAAYSPWQFWDGRRDSLWSQAASPLESPIEHGASRGQLARLVAEDADYRRLHQALFGALPALPQGADEVFINAVKAIAAYERLLLPGETPFDRYADSLKDSGSSASAPAAPPAEAPFGHREVAGLRLFIGKAQCINCHNGPLFTNHEFHNTGVLPAPGALPAKGRAEGVRLVLNDPLNCLGPHSDATRKPCPELRFVRSGGELVAAHKTPSLRNLAGSEPYMHAGQLGALADVLRHYNRAPNAVIGHNEAKPLNLLPYELKRLEAFLRTLDGPLATAPEWLLPPHPADNSAARAAYR